MKRKTPSCGVAFRKWLPPSSSQPSLSSSSSCSPPWLPIPPSTSAKLARLLLSFITAIMMAHLDYVATFVLPECLAYSQSKVELELRLANEKPRNHLDMRHRLDSKGQREGKIIDYKTSDLRVENLLGGLCSSMKSYTIAKEGSQRGQWIKLDDSNTSVPESDKQEAEVHSKYISTYCGRLFADFEDELEEKIKKDLVIAGQVEQLLCWDLSSHCVSKMSDGDDAQANGEILERSDGEL